MAASYRSPIRATRRASLLLYAGVLLFLVLMAWTVSAVSDAWRGTRAHSRAEAVFDLVEVVTPTRPTDIPGALAWLDLEIERYERRRLGSADPDPLRASVAAEPGRVPGVFQPVLGALERPVGEVRPAPDERLVRIDEAEIRGGLPALPGGMQFRSQHFLTLRADDDEEHWLVLTRRRVLDAGHGPAASASDHFLLWAAPYLAAVERELAPLQPSLGALVQVVRIYAVAEDGTFLSLPWIADPGARRRTVWEEGREFRKRPRLPNFVSNEFFFRFDFEPLEEPGTARGLGPALPRRLAPQQSYYSGLYLDIGGHGLVTTLTIPVEHETGLRAVAAVDLSFDIDWKDVARRIEPPLVAQLVTLDEVPSPEGWQPWATILSAVDGRVAPELARVLALLADSERRSGSYVSPAQHHLDHAEPGTVGIFQVARHDWLVVLFPALPSRFPWLAVAPLVALGLLLLFGFETNRRRAEAAQLKAERELAERQNLLDTMRVPLLVVDPNTDRVVYGNEAALGLGFAPGTVAGDLVDDRDGREREHYERMQRASVSARRAYGIPLKVRGPGGETERRWAVVRSVAVAAPIESLRADERHRLGMFFLIEPEADLALYAAELEGGVRTDERLNLAELLSHGVNTPAQVLHSRLDAGGGDPFTLWLGDYLCRRVAVAAWLLDHWHASPPLPGAVSVGPDEVRATLDRFQEIFTLARRDAELRARLHWANGVLSAAGAETGLAPIAVHVDWPERYLFICPVKGGMGFFLEEVLVNAVRHGRPGSRPVVSTVLDPARREIVFEVTNEVAATSRRGAGDLKPYGGRRLLRRMADLFGWRDLDFEESDAAFRVSWSVPASERAAPGDSD